MKDSKFKTIEKIKNPDFFDPDWYLNQYPDVKKINMDPAEHFYKYGARMFRDPSRKFNYQYHYKVFGLGKSENALINYLNSAKADSKKVLFSAYECFGNVDLNSCIYFAERDLCSSLKYTSDIFKINKMVEEQNYENWLFYLNRYLENIKSSPVKIDIKNKNVFFSLYSDTSEKKNGKKVTVIMPAWNCEKTVLYAASSILKQTWENIELIIVDDCSDDDTWDVIKEIKKIDSRVKLIRNKYNVGPYASKNIALKCATGDYITGHDADDWAHPERIYKQVKFLEKNNTQYSLIGMLRMNSYGTITRINSIGKNTIDGAVAIAFISLMIDTKLLRERYGFWDDVRFGGDSELIRRIEAVEGKEIPKDFSLGIIAYDNPDGLTNHPVYGYTPDNRSSVRLKNRKYLTEWHKSIDINSAYVPFPHYPRKFEAEEESLNCRAVMELVEQDLKKMSANN